MSENEEMKKDSVPPQEEKSLAMELLEEQRQQNKRITHIAGGLLVAVIVIPLFIITAFLIYLHSYDFSSSIEQDGVYAMVDSDGNVISSDIEPEQLIKILEIINGEAKDNKD